MVFIKSLAFSTFIVFVIIVLVVSPFIINSVLAESRGKSKGLVLLLTFIFSWIVTLILAFLPKEEDVEIPTYLKSLTIGCFILAVLLSIVPSYRESSRQKSLQESLQQNALETEQLLKELNRK